MFKNNPKMLAALVAAAIAAFGIVQYLAISGQIPVAALARIHWIILPGYWIGGAFGVMLEWFLIAALTVVIMSSVAKRKQVREPGDPDQMPPPGPAQARPEMVAGNPATFGRRGRA
jgi:hypothetical protein